MRRPVWKTAALTAAAILVLFVFTGFAILYSGVYNVAATADHTSIVRWALDTAQRHSVSARVGEVPRSPPVDDHAVQHGFVHFQEMCVMCHGAPGIDRGEFGQGITPTPPDLPTAAETWTPRELFWITKNGIKLAGMPAFGPTHSDEEIWSVVAFLERLPDMSAEEYQSWVDRSTADDGLSSASQGDASGTADHTH